MRSLIVLCLAASLFVVGCSEDDKDPTSPQPGNEYLEPSSPENVMTNFIRSLELNDIAAFDETLAESFEFRSTLENYETLNKFETVGIMNSLFEEALGIEIRLVNNGAQPSALPEFPADDGYMIIPIPSVFLEVRTSIDQGAGPITLSVPGDLASFVFSETSLDRWQIVMQEDPVEYTRPRAFAVEESHWADVLTVFDGPGLSPRRVVGEFAVALESLDLDALSLTLAEPAEFRSVDPEFESRDRTDLMAVYMRMFAESQSIATSLVQLERTPSNLSEFPAASGFMMITVPDAILRVRTTRDEGAGPITYFALGDMSRFVVQETAPYQWQIVLHEDHGSSAVPTARTENRTWTEILAVF